MSNLTNLAPAYTFGSLLNTTSVNGLTSILQVIQDGFGRNSPLSLSTNALNINTEIGGEGAGLYINDIQLLSDAIAIDAVCTLASFGSFTTALTLPKGTTAQRPNPAVSNGGIRYNITTKKGEICEDGVWAEIGTNSPNFSGFTTAISLPRGTTGERPAPPENGDLRYNTTTEKFEGYENNTWINFAISGSGYSPGNPTYLTASVPNNNLSLGTPDISSIGTNTTRIGMGISITLPGNDNTICGALAFADSTGGNRNSIFGAYCSNESLSVSDCSSYGYRALISNQSNNLSAFGAQAGFFNINGTLDCFGYRAAYNNVDGNGISAFGSRALFNNVDGDFNTSFGFESTFTNVTGDNITSIGYQAAYYTLGDNITAIGFQSLYQSTSSSNVTAVGSLCLSSATVATDCSGIGRSAGQGLGSGQRNIFIGKNAFFDGTIINRTANDCIFIGANTYSTVASLTNAIVIGNGLTASQDNTLILGNGANVGIGTTTPSQKLHVVGDVQFKGTTSGWANTGLVQQQFAYLVTAGATQTIDFPVRADMGSPLSAMVVVRVKISAIRQVGNGGAYGNGTGAALYDTDTSLYVTVPMVSPPAVTFVSDDASFTPTATWSTSGSNLRLTLTADVDDNNYFVVSTETTRIFNSSA